MRILITGGAGFIGSHIVDAYLKAGHRVAVIDNLTSGFRHNLNPRARFYKADIRDLAKIEAIFKKERPEVVSHHAALVAVVESLRDPVPTLAVNVMGTANVLLCFGKYGPAAAGASVGKRGKGKFIFSSTGGAIYGQPKKIPADESTALAPLSAYGLSKYLAENMIQFYARTYGFEYLIFRYTNVYGPRQNPKGEAGEGAIFGGLLKQGRRPVIFGDGTKSRDYVYVDDIVQANLLAFKRGKNAIINIGWGKAVSDQDIFDTIAQAVNFKAIARAKRTKDTPIYAPYRQGEVYQITLDAKMARRVLGWKPTVKLADGVRKTMASL